MTKEQELNQINITMNYHNAVVEYVRRPCKETRDKMNEACNALWAISKK